MKLSNIIANIEGELISYKRQLIYVQKRQYELVSVKLTQQINK